MEFKAEKNNTYHCMTMSKASMKVSWLVSFWYQDVQQNMCRSSLLKLHFMRVAYTGWMVSQQLYLNSLH